MEMLGLYDNFPQTSHLAETFTSSLANKKLQERLIQVLQKINSEKLSFEQVCVPTVPNGSVIFEFGIADTGGFNFLNDEEAKNLQEAVANQSVQVMDWFCGIRYYKETKLKKIPLKFDYYMIRVGFGESEVVEFLVHHERGPRYISPQDLIAFITRRVNEANRKKILRWTRQS